jgi:hypothetical protein
MRKITPFVFLGCVLLILASCSKEKSVDTLGGGGGTTAGSTGSEKGTWKLLSMRGITNQTIEITDGVDVEKSVTVSDYTTDNNTGTIKFDGSTMTGTNIGYSVDKMIMTGAVDQSKVELNMGLTQRTTTHAVQIVTLQKQ